MKAATDCFRFHRITFGRAGVSSVDGQQTNHTRAEKMKIAVHCMFQELENATDAAAGNVCLIRCFYRKHAQRRLYHQELLNYVNSAESHYAALAENSLTGAMLQNVESGRLLYFIYDGRGPVPAATTLYCKVVPEVGGADAPPVSEAVPITAAFGTESPYLNSFSGDNYRLTPDETAASRE